MKTKSEDKDVCTSISECAAIILENFHRGYEHKMKIKKIICLVLFACVLLVTLTSCSETVEERQEKVNEIFEEALNALDVDYTLEIKSNTLNDYVTDRGKKTNYTFNVNIAINDESLTGEDIFGIIETIDGVKVSYTTIYRSYSFNDDSYYIEDECILIQGYDHDIAYTPIAEKQGVDLTTAEKDAICNWIDEKYEYYDLYSGGYSGNKYSDIIFETASEAFHISLDDLKTIWMKRYS